MNTRPPATFNNRPIPRADWNRFGPYGQATEMLALVNAGIEAIPGVTIVVPAHVVESSLEDDFQLNVPVGTPPLPTDIGDWTIKCNFAVASGSQAAVDYALDEWACVLSDRELAPDMGSGDRNYQEVGHGANTIDVPVPGKIAINLQADTGDAEAYWVPA